MEVKKYRRPPVRTGTPLKTLAAWQMNPETLSTNNVQVWQEGSMIGTTPIESARKMVESKFYACINEQAIFLR